jgi:hypothetical protein
MNDTRARDLAAGKIDAAQAKVEAKAQDALEKKQEARESVSGTLSELADIYTKLDKEDAIVNSSKGVFSNALARVSSTKAGQIFGQTLGTKPQALRDRIAQIKPLLLTDMMQAAGLKSTQLNSNRELEFYLEATTDISRELGANLAALNRLDKRFGSGRGIVKADPRIEAQLEAEFNDYVKKNPPVNPNSPPPGLVLPPGATYIGPAP